MTKAKSLIYCRTRAIPVLSNFSRKQSSRPNSARQLDLAFRVLSRNKVFSVAVAGREEAVPAVQHDNVAVRSTTHLHVKKRVPRHGSAIGERSHAVAPVNTCIFLSLRVLRIKLTLQELTCTRLRILELVN